MSRCKYCLTEIHWNHHSAFEDSSFTKEHNCDFKSIAKSAFENISKNEQEILFRLEDLEFVLTGIKARIERIERVLLDNRNL